MTTMNDPGLPGDIPVIPEELPVPAESPEVEPAQVPETPEIPVEDPDPMPDEGPFMPETPSEMPSSL